MCLAVPGKIIAVNEGADPGTDRGSVGALWRTGRVDFGGIVKEISLGLLPDAREGDYILAHVGFAISRLDEAEAQRILEDLKRMGAADEVEGIGEAAG